MFDETLTKAMGDMIAAVDAYTRLLVDRGLVEPKMLDELFAVVDELTLSPKRRADGHYT